jgi:hypothetical protein
MAIGKAEEWGYTFLGVVKYPNEDNAQKGY